MQFLITGAGRGIGLELTQFALEGGHSVFALVRDPNNARQLSQVKKEYGDKLIILKVDITNAEELNSAAAAVDKTPIDILINNAGVLTGSDDGLTQLDLEELKQTLEVNAISPLNVAKTFLPNLKASKAAKLVNITSQMGSIHDNSSGGYYAYRMSKAALNMFTKSFSIDFPNITALTLHPGWVRTDMGGAQAPVLPRESARGLYKVITEAGPELTGHFVDYKGKELPW